MLGILVLPDEGRELPQALAAVALGVVTLRLTFSLVISNRARNELLHNSLHDSLTGVGNRTLLNDRIGHAIDMRARDDRALLVLVCDLDDFKSINDTWGAQAGDEVLVEAAERLASTLRDGDTVARVGGDEFAILAEGVERERDLSEIAHRILAAFQQPFAISGHRVPVRLSIGASTLADCDSPGCDGLDLLTQADIAMHVAKSQGKNRLQRFRVGMTLPDSDSPVLVEELADAIAARRIQLAFQPVYDLRTGTIDGFEALARWESPSGPVSPDVFIPMAERAGLAVKLGSQLLNQACRQLGKWSAAMGAKTLNLGVNLSPAQLNNEHLPSQLRRMLSKYDVAPSQLIVEITERALLSDSETALEVCRRLRRLGVRLAIDDFGVGYSALSHLHKFPVDIVKIDKSFVQQTEDTTDAAAFIRGIVSMAEAMHLSTVVEGIETEDQLALARDMGCGFAQGYLLGKPTAPEAIKIAEVSALSAAAHSALHIAVAAVGA
jgi:diguanylate cyclase (GGDEF)-like protein